MFFSLQKKTPVTSYLLYLMRSYVIPSVLNENYCHVNLLYFVITPVTSYLLYFIRILFHVIPSVL